MSFKKFLQTGILLFSIPCILISQDIDTINIDFGAAASTSVGGWNNITNAQSGEINELITSSGTYTGMNVAVTDAFNGINANGLSAETSLDIPQSASSDSFFGNSIAWSGVIETTGGVTFTNLDPTLSYSFSIFASRDASDNRETTYLINGASEVTSSINVSSNTNTVAEVKDIYPAADGSIKITASAGSNNTNSYKFFYMGVIKVYFTNNYTPPPGEASLIYPNGDEAWAVGKTASIKWNSIAITNLDLEYSIDNGINWKSIALAVPAIDKEFVWTIPSEISENCLVRLLDSEDHSVGDTSNNVFSIVEDDGKEYQIIVLGSSTAAGTGPSVVDSAWVWMYTEIVESRSTNFTVSNLAKGGFTTYNILPTEYSIPAGINKRVDPERNITKALSMFPEAIIINLPSNDAANNYPVRDQLANYDTIAKLAEQFGVSLWVTTPQPKRFNAAQDQIQLDLYDSTFSIFAEKAIDFWDGLYEEGSYDLKDIYDSGDGTHVNNAGHKIFLSRVMGAHIDDYLHLNYDKYLYTSLPGIELVRLAGSSMDLSIHTDVAWTVSVDQDWIELSATEGSADEQMSISSTSDNLIDSDRYGILTFKSAELDDVHVEVRQKGTYYFSLTVNAGTGAGDFPAGDTVDIIADVPAEGYEFDKWTGDIENIQNINASSTTLLMPESNIEVIATYNEITGVQTSERFNSILVYPNPAIEQVAIQNMNIDDNLEVMDVSGRCLLKHIASDQELKIDVSNWPEGIYIVRVSDNKHSKVFKLLVK